MYTLVVLLACLLVCQSYLLQQSFRSTHMTRKATSASAPENDGNRETWETAEVSKGLTHIKYNKYAPPPEEAAKMTDEEFRASIYKRMKEAENERRKSGPVGGASSEDYLNSLSGGNE